MSRLSGCFARLKSSGRTALVPFITAGDPSAEITTELMHTLVQAGANVIELGIPFSDPMAEGPVIQRASERALSRHVNLHDVLDMVARFRAEDNETPVVLMGYLNPIEVMGYDNFARAAGAAGADGVITVDMPPEEADEYIQALQSAQIDPVFLLAPTTTAERMAKVCKAASGFVYYVSLKGVTGAASLDVSAVADKVAQIRQYTDLPVGVGFGIKNAQDAAAVGAVADAVVVGSALVELIEQTADHPVSIMPHVEAFIAGMRRALDDSGHRQEAIKT